MCIQEIIIFLQRHIILSITWILLLFGVVYTGVISWLFKSSEILRDKAILLVNRKNAVIIDVRDKNDYNTGYIVNSIHIVMEDIRNNNVLKLEKFKKNPLIVVHDNSIVAHSIRKQLYKLKFEEVYVLHGGIVGWKSDNFPLLLKNKTLK